MVPGILLLRMMEAASLLSARLLSERRTIHGIRTYLWEPDGDVREGLFSKVSEGLSLLKEADPVRFDRFRKGFSSILVFGSSRSAAARADVRRRTCMMNPEFLSDPGIDRVHLAAVFAHEGTHAWIEAAGVGYRETVRHRVEGICLSAEAAFFRRLPVWPAELGRWVYFRRSMAQSHFTNESFEQRTVERLEDRGTSRNRIRFLKALAGKTTRRDS